MLPQFMVIGAQKSASSFVHECLREHPQLFMPQGEVAFFEDPFYSPDRIQDLEGLFSKAEPQHLVGLKRADLLGDPVCAGRVHSHCPEERFIVVLRNPVERAISAYFWYLKAGHLPIIDIETGMRHILTGEYEPDYPKASEILSYGLYADHLQRYWQLYDRSRFLILFHHEFADESATCIRRIYDFLGCDSSFVPKSLARKPKKTVYSLDRIRFLQNRPNRAPFIIGSQSAPSADFYVTQTAPSLLYGALIMASDRFVLSRFYDNTKPQLSTQLRQQLSDYYADSNRRLAELLRVNLERWQR